ncbi:MAG: LEA type 2 family protein, partial [Candidatus Obscuribacterales bacterium]|nr:LEA type 2 family protein [Steroidobacteraceae bacterium]
MLYVLNRMGAVVTLALVMSACASFTSKLATPKLSLVTASMVSGDVFSQTFRVRIHVDNPNATALPIKQIEYELFLEGDSFAEGTAAAPFVVPALGSTEFDLTMRTNFVSSIARLLSRLNGSNKNTVQYGFIGKLTADLP